jgi:aminopeptidase YwaD
MKKFVRVLHATLLTVFAASALLSQSRSAHVTVDELRAHVRYLASDELEGRRAGTEGARKAAEYIAGEFKAYGLQPAGDNGSYLQKFDFVGEVRLGANTFSSTAKGRTKHFRIDADYRPLGFSASGVVSGAVVFAGYGIAAPSLNYDDYAGIDVKDKIVLVLRHSPKSDSLRGDFGPFSTLRYKALKAKELGAKAILIVTGPLDAEQDELIQLSYDPSAGSAGIVAVNITQRTANELLQETQITLKELQETIHRLGKPKSLPLEAMHVQMSIAVEEVKRTTYNIVGFLEGSDPVLKNEVIVIGAHHDHLGYGGEGSGSLRPDTIAIHNGADDNASGTSGLLELAQAFAAKKHELKRSVLLISFGAEELGLLGSAYYVKNPTVPIERMVAMLNMDMIGRLDNRKLIVYGIGTSPGFEALAKKHNARSAGDSIFALRLVRDGFGPSDHSSFYAKQIPVFHFFTDVHSDYHRPTDDWDKLNYEGMAEVVRYVENIALDLLRSEARPQYVAVEPPRPAATGRSSGVYMGTVPDFGEQVEGMKLSGVREGSPAAKAGLQAGDIIIRFGKMEIKNLSDFSYALGEYKPGDEVEVVIKRGTEIKTLKVKLERRN